MLPIPTPVAPATSFALPTSLSLSLPLLPLSVTPITIASTTETIKTLSENSNDSNETLSLTIEQLPLAKEIANTSYLVRQNSSSSSSYTSGTSSESTSSSYSEATSSQSESDSELSQPRVPSEQQQQEQQQQQSICTSPLPLAPPSFPLPVRHATVTLPSPTLCVPSIPIMTSTPQKDNITKLVATKTDIITNTEVQNYKHSNNTQILLTNANKLEQPILCSESKSSSTSSSSEEQEQEHESLEVIQGLCANVNLPFAQISPFVTDNIKAVASDANAAHWLEGNKSHKMTSIVTENTSSQSSDVISSNQVNKEMVKDVLTATTISSSNSLIFGGASYNEVTVANKSMRDIPHQHKLLTTATLECLKPCNRCNRRNQERKCTFLQHELQNISLWLSHTTQKSNTKVNMLCNAEHEFNNLVEDRLTVSLETLSPACTRHDEEQHNSNTLDENETNNINNSNSNSNSNNDNISVNVNQKLHEINTNDNLFKMRIEANSNIEANQDTGDTELDSKDVNVFAKEEEEQQKLQEKQEELKEVISEELQNLANEEQISEATETIIDIRHVPLESERKNNLCTVAFFGNTKELQVALANLEDNHESDNE